MRLEKAAAAAIECKVDRAAAHKNIPNPNFCNPEPGVIKGEEVITHIMFYFAYPRLDINVSKGMNHLLKAPFVVHPKTQRICVPLDPARVQDFDPSTVPTLNEILTELDTNTDKTAKVKTTHFSLSLSLSSPPPLPSPADRPIDV